MISADQVQQASQAAIAVSIGSTWSCTPHLPDHRWYVHFEDFKKICGHKVSAGALRSFETMTNTRIVRLCESASIPDDTLPHEDDLWIEASNPDLDFWTLHIWDQSTYSFCLRDKTEPGHAISLLELGFLRRRFVAYPGRYLLEPVATTVYLDGLGNPFIIVDDDKQGYYVGIDGELHCAADEGYTVMRRQYLYCIEAINAALSKLAGQSPPVPMPRWHSLQRKALTSETTTSTASQGQSITSQQTSVAQCLPPNDDNHERDKEARKTLLFANKNNTDVAMLSLENPENRMSTKKLINNSVPLHSAPWSPETLIALSSCHLAVPDPAQCDEEQWRRDWAEPAQWLIDFTKDLDCTRAWEIIERYICAMIAGPTWHARKANKSFVSYGTLRHVVGWHKETLQLDGHNWKSTADALRKEPWADYAHIEYSGPPFFEEVAQSSYAQGYSAQSLPTAHDEEPTAQSDAQSMETAHYVEGTAQVLGDDAQTEPVVEVVAGDVQNDDCAMSNERPAQSVRTAQCEEETAQSVEVEDAQCAMETETTAQGMDITTTCIVDAQIRREYPDITIGVSPADDPGFFILAIEVAMDTWYDIVSLADYLAPTPQTQEAIDAAEAYGRQRQATDSNVDSQGPPGDMEV